jgi:integrase
MEARMGKLTAATVRGLRSPGKYADGAGLMLHVKNAKRRYWVFRYERAGKARHMTLGTADTVSLAEARARHTEARSLLLRGVDPLDERGKAKVDLTHRFADVAEACIAARSQDWVPRWTAQWRNTLRDYVLPSLGKRPVAEIGVEHVLRCLRPIWASKPTTANRVRSRIEAVMDYASAMRWREGPNPAVWRGGLKPLLAKPRRTTKHLAALDWASAPALIANLPLNGNVAERCLAFLILTATRSGEARGCRWSEIDMANAIWTIPAARMKARQEHRVPLPGAALAILKPLAEVRTGELVFFGRGGGPLADTTLKDVLRQIGHGDITVHGFRSTFRDWCADTGKPADLAEMALAHVTGSAVVRAYARSDLLDRRRTLMDQWSVFMTQPPAVVVPLRAAGRP